MAQSSSPFQSVKQNKWLRGLNAAASIFAQPEGILKAVSNLIFTRRGAVRTCDGSLILSSFEGEGPAASQGLILALSPFQPQPDLNGTATPYYVMLQQLSGITSLALATPIVSTITISGTQGALSSGTYRYKVTAYDYNGQTTYDAEVVATATSANGTATITMANQVLNAYKWGVYRTAANGAANSEGLVEQLLIVSQPSVFEDSLPDSAIDFSVTPPATNTTQPLAVIEVNGAAYSAPDIVAVLPATATQPSPCSSSLGSYGGSWTGGNVYLNPSGGIVGVSCQIPQAVPFTNSVILAMGNGVPPQEFNGTAVSALSNTFSASWPIWSSSTVYALGTEIQASTGGTYYIFTATQGGESGASQPAWNATQGEQNADGTVIWENSGNASIIAPRGAAHAIVYAGSLWLWNTYPQNTSDGLDGPSCLKMSNANNPNSWNPVNTAFVNENDGTQGMGLATFTVAEAGIAPEGTLVLFKDFSTYQVTGVFGASDFSIQQAQTDMGCVAPRTILFIPGFGIARMTHMGIAVYDGVRDRLISEEIRPYLFPDPEADVSITPVDWSYIHLSKSWQTANPPMYCVLAPLIGQAGAMTRMFCYDLVLKVWTIIDFPSPLSFFAGVQSRIEGTIPITMICGTNDGTIRRIFAGDATWDGTDVSWSFKTPEVFIDAGATRLMVRRVKVRGMALDSPFFSIALDQQGYSNSAIIPVYWAKTSAGFGPYAFEAIAAGSGMTQLAMNVAGIFVGAKRIQVEAVEWEILPKPSVMGVPTLAVAGSEA